MKKISLVLVIGSILGFVGSHVFAADIENVDSHCSHALQLIDNEAKILLVWLRPDSGDFSSEEAKCVTNCDQKYPPAGGDYGEDRGPNDQAYDECLDACGSFCTSLRDSFEAKVQTKFNHYRENWMNAQKESCDLAPYEADHTKIENMVSLNWNFDE